MLSLTFSKIITEEHKAINLTLLNIFHGPDKEKLDIT